MSHTNDEPIEVRVEQMIAEFGLDYRLGKAVEHLILATHGDVAGTYAACVDRALKLLAKPAKPTREKLSKSGWKWAPSQEAWQRQLTNAGISSGKNMIETFTILEVG